MRHNYGVSTTLPDGRPHARPVRGVWLDNTFHCGGEHTRWARNLAAGSEIVVHRKSGDDVVVIEGTAGKLAEGAGPELLERLDAAYEGKYGVRYGTPFWMVHPEKVLAWSDHPTDATRWEFEP